MRKASPLGHTDYSYGPAELGMNHWPLGIYRSAQGNSTSTEILYLPTAQGPLPIAAEIDGQLYAIETDHLHTPRRLSNAQGQGVWQWITSGFGEVPASHAGNGFVLEGEGSGSGPNLGPNIDFALRYPGQVRDTETGLHYNHHRYYDPQLTVGYTQADPIGLEGGWNRFGYVDGNPLGVSDPEGLAAPALAPLAPVVVQICRQAVMQAGATLAKMLAKNVILEVKECNENDCKENNECDPPAGTVCLEPHFHENSTPHSVQDIFGNKRPKTRAHIHTWQMNKLPDGSCRWNKRNRITYNYAPVNLKFCDSYASWLMQNGK